MPKKSHNRLFFGNVRTRHQKKDVTIFMKETVTMWTRQVPAVWDQLQQESIYHVKEKYVILKNDSLADYYLNLYRWYTKTARKYLDIPEGLQYPIWLSLDENMMLQSVENTVILKVEVPKDKFLICNMTAWDYRVNYWYVPLNDLDAKKHADELRRYGIQEEDDLIRTEKGNFYPVLRRKIVDSWDRVFELKPKERRDAAATIWELRREWVEDIYTG